MIDDFLSFYIVVSKCEEWKDEAFLCSAPGNSQHRYTPAVEFTASNTNAVESSESKLRLGTCNSKTSSLCVCWPRRANFCSTCITIWLFKTYFYWWPTSTFGYRNKPLFRTEYWW